jgi:hypothetical protein
MVESNHRPNDALADAVDRVQREFLEMPGLRLTHAQAARLCALPPETCEAAFACLMEMRFLARTPGATFMRASDRASGA